MSKKKFRVGEYVHLLKDGHFGHIRQIKDTTALFELDTTGPQQYRRWVSLDDLRSMDR